ncbi:MAG: NAD(P)-binding domain-containing protein [Bacteroidales bacterium]|nr:NAD(P)-binding domain-containing protein [Bacteroidales bacterium]
MKIAIIGAGNMGGATALGLAAAFPDAQITVTAKHAESLEKFKARGLQTSLDNVAAARGAEIVVLGVKPWLAQGVLQQIRGELSGKILISLCAGIPAEQMRSWLSGTGLSGACTVIPNLAIEYGESMSFIHELSGTAETLRTVKMLFDATGKCAVVDERRLNAGMMLASCGTAFALRYVRAAAEGGVELGLYPREAIEAALQTVKGAAVLLEERGTHPEAEIDRVTTPGGITIKGLNAMEEAGFTAAVIAGLKAWTPKQ